MSLKKKNEMAKSNAHKLLSHPVPFQILPAQMRVVIDKEMMSFMYQPSPSLAHGLQPRRSPASCVRLKLR